VARQSGIAVGLKSIAAHILSKRTPLGHPVPNIRMPGLGRKFAAGISIEEGGASCGREGPRPHDAPVRHEHQMNPKSGIHF
jgi:hypothetical protein